MFLPLPALLTFGFFLGVLGLLLRLLLAKDLDGIKISEYAIGALLGGLFSAALIFPIESLTKADAVLLILSGFVGAEFMHRLLSTR